MLGFFLHRLGFSILAVLMISLILFVLTAAIPESPARIVLGADAPEVQVQQFEHEHGLDRPLLVRYGEWVDRLALHGDFGTSVVTGLGMNEQIAETLPVTLELVIVAFVFAVVLSIALGTASAVFENSWIDHASRIFTVIGVSVPGFWTALILILFFAIRIPIFPPGGITPVSEGLGPHIMSLVLPAFCLGIFYTAVLSRMTRSSLIEVLGQDYIRTARATGLPRSLVLRYALKNAMVPVVTVTSMSFGYMFGWALIIETVFNIAGMSGSLLNAISQRDYATVRAVVFVFTLIFLLANLAADLLNAWLNPRLRTVQA
ncbi:peptide/nickel transport system permease protein [Faunimonas pinastri]|uniref:Peptide/nickel transport system permease protein n=1 Tax=Faunimonas pinastri TaxID=1855383 RepID=A0A1H9B6F6_9HYPH|nr:ABC transporter permease [Faunimonas pinastri]SEP84297.1 peptide/nickel transport system permease protein [Faunimonas pinastri]